MLRFADLVEKNMEELAQLETWDSGKPYEQALTAELPLFVRMFRYYAGKLYPAKEFALVLCKTVLPYNWFATLALQYNN